MPKATTTKTKTKSRTHTDVSAPLPATDTKPRHPTAIPAHLPTEGYCRLPQILSVLSIGKTTFLNGVRDGRFPKPIHLGRSTLWKVEDIRRVIAQIEAGMFPPSKSTKRKEAA